MSSSRSSKIDRIECSALQPPSLTLTLSLITLLSPRACYVKTRKRYNAAAPYHVLGLYSPTQMTKPFALCSLPDFALEICLAARAAECSALDAAAAALLLPRLTNAEATEAVLQRHPLVRGASGLVCTGTAENKRAWCSMLCDLFSATGQCLESLRFLNYQQGKKGLGAPFAPLVSDAAILRVYLV
jgi:hypothetical protein